MYSASGNATLVSASQFLKALPEIMDTFGMEMFDSMLHRANAKLPTLSSSSSAKDEIVLLTIIRKHTSSSISSMVFVNGIFLSFLSGSGWQFADAFDPGRVN